MVIKVVVVNKCYQNHARLIADKLNLTIEFEIDYNNYCLVYGNNLAVFAPKQLNLKPLTIDFVGGKTRHRRKFSLNLTDNLAKAIGAKTKPLVIDATAGLGQDSFALASLGCKIILIEQNLILLELLQFALKLALLNPDTEKIANNNLQLIAGNAEIIMPQLTINPEVIYLDPMFPHNKNRRKPNKAMQYLRSLVGSDDNSEQLFIASQKLKPKRIVVKRSVKDDFIIGLKPNHQVVGKTTRYDIYYQ